MTWIVALLVLVAVSCGESEVAEVGSQANDPSIDRSEVTDGASGLGSSTSDSVGSTSVVNGGGGEALSHTVELTELNRRAATGGDPLGAMVVVDDDGLRDAWGRLSDTEPPLLGESLGLVVTGGPGYRNTEVVEVGVDGDQWTVTLLVHPVGECDGLDVEASDVHLVLVTAPDPPAHVVVLEDLQDGCGD